MAVMEAHMDSHVDPWTRKSRHALISSIHPLSLRDAHSVSSRRKTCTSIHHRRTILTKLIQPFDSSADNAVAALETAGKVIHSSQEFGGDKSEIHELPRKVFAPRGSVAPSRATQLPW